MTKKVLQFSGEAKGLYYLRLFEYIDSLRPIFVFLKEKVCGASLKEIQFHGSIFQFIFLLRCWFFDSSTNNKKAQIEKGENCSGFDSYNTIFATLLQSQESFYCKSVILTWIYLKIYLDNHKQITSSQMQSNSEK